MPSRTISVFANPPYGISKVTTHQGGTQYNHSFDRFFVGASLTGGAEYVDDDVLDEIEAYNYRIDQTTTTLGSSYRTIGILWTT